MTAERLLMLVLVGGIIVGCAVVLQPFVSAILWAAILVFSTWPIYLWARERLRLGRGGTAAAMVAIEAVLLILPLGLIIPSGSEDVEQLRLAAQHIAQTGLPSAPDWFMKVPLLGAPLTELWNGWASDLSTVGVALRPYVGALAKLALTILLGIADGLLQVVLALFVAFFFYASGERLAQVITALLVRVAGQRAEHLIAVSAATVRGVVYGLLGTALVQGILTALGLWAAGVPRPVLLGSLAGSMSVLPVGAPAIWIPASLWLLSGGHDWKAAGLCVWGLVFISGSDNLIRPLFIARGTRLPFLLTMLGVLGGALAFGLLGIFVGPVLLTVGFTLVSEWARPGSVMERSDPARPWLRRPAA